MRLFQIATNQTFHYQTKPEETWNENFRFPTTFCAQAQFGAGDRNLSADDKDIKKRKDQRSKKPKLRLVRCCRKPKEQNFQGKRKL